MHEQVVQPVDGVTLLNICHNCCRDRLYEAEMVAASSYQKDGRPAPPRLIAAANTPTISGSSAGGGRLLSTPRRTRRYGARTDSRVLRLLWSNCHFRSKSIKPCLQLFFSA
jgi:hypothetical protein